MTPCVKEPFNGFSHLGGALLSLAGLAVLVTLAAMRATPWHVVSFSVYGSSMVLLYTASALYHLLPLSEKGTRIFKTADHMMIYFLIAGTYTPFCLVPLRGAWGWSIFGVVWGLALAGMALKLLWLDAPRWLSTTLYLGLGWICLVAIYPLLQAMPLGGLLWLLAGGVAYSLGALIYATKKPDPWPGVFGFHEIFHVFVLAGSFCHFWVMVRYLIRL
ncbi:MAG: hemolysin III family protein [Deltaproteobacteria bacterium]|nr:hemolysin III family protein [Deltaproteobacteria bacterium]